MNVISFETEASSVFTEALGVLETQTTKTLMNQVSSMCMSLGRSVALMREKPRSRVQPGPFSLSYLILL